MAVKQILALRLASFGDGNTPSASICFLAVARNASSKPSVIEVHSWRPPPGASEDSYLSQRISAGGWFAVWTNLVAQASIFFVRGQPIALNVRPPKRGGDWVQVMVEDVNRVTAGQVVPVELQQLGTSLYSKLQSLNDVQALVQYLASPTGLQVLRGTRCSPHPGMLVLRPDSSQTAELAVGQHPDPDMMLPVRLVNLRRRWTVGLWQLSGYVLGHYGNGSGRYTELGVDANNSSHFPLYVGLAHRTHVRVGHPVVAVGDDAEQVFISVTHLRLGSGSTHFHVALNNPLDRALSVKVLAFEALQMPEQNVTLRAGEHRVLQ